MAFATAELGYSVTAIELLERPALLAKSLSDKITSHSMRVIQDDFYSVQLNESFDIVCYWDGFGIGEDMDQVRLLRRAEQWLKSGGIVLLDIYSPWYWSKVAGTEMTIDTVKRRYEFIAKDSRMIDHWWMIGKEEQNVAQSLRCYSTTDLKLLLREPGLCLVEEEIVPSGAVNYAEGTYQEKEILEGCMQYPVKLVKR
ncbi:class I SAM-dependent methyltransferase [Alicyclobacillus mengziensis]|uniref:Class I SAM-dependent methyltransferase n=1 Tax=Alicyclobacillus mengziensis TaxID=2931921 RepID=A0A9X7VV29_9BACL|nr:class I SAM-dependent methyltransferase [Alicyclobacillus mengziensis]QSO45658.1 class I SAM-dependent methyltransferase [Alicyclobacillus mengziensis]